MVKEISKILYILYNITLYRPDGKLVPFGQNFDFKIGRD